MYRERKKKKKKKNTFKQKKPQPTKNSFYLSLFPGNIITFIYLDIDLSIYLNVFFWMYVCVHVIT